MSPVLVFAQSRDAHQVTAVVATAVRALPVASWLVPDPPERQRVLYASFRMLVDHALDHGHVLMTADRCAVAVWLPRDRPLPAIDGYEQRLKQACDPYTDRFEILHEVVDARRPAAPHHHLALLGVDPDRQRRGLGSALLCWYHRRLDTAGLPAYVEASSAAGRRLYLRHGYTDRDPPIDLPDDGPRLWPMWRLPQPGSP